MIIYRLVAEPAADLDVEAAFTWYQNERTGLGIEFLDELRAAYGRIVDGPLKYRELRSEIRRALLRRFSYAVYFAVEEDAVVISPSCMRTAIRRRGNCAEAKQMERPGVCSHSEAKRVPAGRSFAVVEQHRGGPRRTQ